MSVYIFKGRQENVHALDAGSMLTTMIIGLFTRFFGKFDLL
jgi:hypothetical protein